ncbi:MAG TPA: cupin domain-containing protein [Bradyrhizobium sp.]
MTSEDVLKLLNLEPNATCGFVRETYRASQQIAPGGLPAPFADGRPLGSALYFMVTPQAPVRLHRIRNDQLSAGHSTSGMTGDTRVRSARLMLR